MRIVFIISLAVLLIFLYLNRSYSYFYSYFGTINLTPPPQKASYNFNYSNNKKTFKYVALGDSLTAGVGTTSFKKTFPYLQADSLSKKHGFVTFVNLAKPGFTTEDLLKKETQSAINEKPDYITLLVGINDIHNLTSSKRFKENYEEILLELSQKTKAEIVLINVPYLGSDKIVLFPYNLLLDYKTKQFNKIIKSLAIERNLKYIDLYEQTKNNLKDPHYYSNDLFHPSESGYILWEKIIDAN